MAQPFIGEIRLLGFPRVPSGWVACDGSLLAISQFPTLYNLIGTTFGGDGASTFGVPDLRGRLPICQGNGNQLTPRVLGEMSGEPSHTLLQNEMPSHGHGMTSTTNVGTTATPGTTVHLATTSISTDVTYAPQAGIPSYITMSSQSVVVAGGSVAHDNMMPTLVGNFCICTDGIYPSQS
jgi:microcystin-dependent protein